MTTTEAPLDLADPAVVADPYPSFARARAAAPVQWHEGLGLWLAFTHAESNAVLRDRRLLLFALIFGPTMDAAQSVSCRGMADYQACMDRDDD